MARGSASASFTVVSTVMVWVTMSIAAAALWPIYESERLVLVVAVSLAVGTAIAIAGAAYRWPSFVVLLVTVGGYLAVGVPVAVPDQALGGVLPTLPGLRDLVLGSGLGWKQLVTITLPVGSFEALPVPALVVMLFGTTTAVSVALRARYGELAVIVPAIVFVLGVAFGSAATSWLLPVALILLPAMLIWLIWARWYRRRASIHRLVTEPASGTARQVEARDTRLGYRATIGAALTMAVAVAVGLGAVWLFPVPNERQVIRTAVEKPFDPREHASPLSSFRAYHQPSRADQPMFRLQGLPEGARIRIATLDTYDGVVYAVGSDQVASASGAFVRVPTSFDQSALDGERVTVTVQVQGYEGIWMPTIGQLERVTFTGPGAADHHGSFFYNDNGGTAVVTEGLRSGDQYRLNAVMPTAPAFIPVSLLEPGSAEVPPAQPLPEELARVLGVYVGAAQTPGARLEAMLDGLRTDGYVSHGVRDDEPASRSGHAADRITQLLTGQRMIGDAEQYAVTAALMAGELGFPARVVFGFVPDDVNRDGTATVHGDDVSAWIEVNTTRYGWVALDPNPEPREIPEEEPEDPTQVARPQSPVQPPPNEPDFDDEQLQPDSSQEELDAPNPLLATLLAIAQVTGIALIAISIVLAPFAAIAIAKVRRRMLRRRASSAIARISGGWQEFEDAVIDHGYNPPPSPTRSEVARTVGGSRSLVLASVADRAVFSPDAAADDEADKVWRAVDELRGALGHGRTRWQRVKALVSVRSLGGYSVKSLFRR